MIALQLGGAGVRLSLPDIELVLVLLLLCVVGFGLLSQRLAVPYPIVMVIGGLAVSFLPGIPRFSLQPDVVFLGVLPPLLFAAAFTTSWRDFRFNLVSIVFLAFGLVGFTVLGVALIAQWILPGFDWRLGLVLGAVVSTTDAIAATSIARRVGLPKRIVDILEGESLLNDASGLLALEFAVAAVVTGQTPSLLEGVVRLLYLVVGGVAIGLVLGKLVDLLERQIDHSPIEITISLVTPYMAYLGAERIHSSGVFAAVACGLYLGRRSATYFSSVVRIEAWAFWNTLVFILNGLVFLLIGLQLPYILGRIENLSLGALLLRGALFSAALILLRAIWVFPSAPASFFIRRKLGQNAPMPSRGRVLIVAWTGMRGVVALAAALSLPAVTSSGAPFPQRPVILFLTFCVIFVTLVLQGFTLPALIRRLRISEPAPNRCEEAEARRIMVEAALHMLEETPDRADPEMKPIYDDLVRHYQTRLPADTPEECSTGEPPQELYEDAARRLRDEERAAAVQLRDEERINDEVLRGLLRELDLLDARQIARYQPSQGLN